MPARLCPSSCLFMLLSPGIYDRVLLIHPFSEQKCLSAYLFLRDMFCTSSNYLYGHLLRGRKSHEWEFIEHRFVSFEGSWVQEYVDLVAQKVCLLSKLQEIAQNRTPTENYLDQAGYLSPLAQHLLGRMAAYSAIALLGSRLARQPLMEACGRCVIHRTLHSHPLMALILLR